MNTMYRSKKQEWAEEKICRSKSIVELNDEFERGCDIFIKKGICNCKCENCHLQRAYNVTLRYLKMASPKVINVTINGNVTVNVK